LVPTNRTFRDKPGSILEGIRILHDMCLLHDNVEAALDFHVFDVHDFDILIGHPIEKVFQEVPTLGTLNVRLGREIFSIPISQPKNSPAEISPAVRPD
jgi:hypothetical protein